MLGVLNISLVLNMPVFWIYNSFEYARVPYMAEYTSVIPEYAWLWLDMPQYLWICLNCLNDFCFTFPHCNPLPTWKRNYLFRRLCEGCFLEETKFDFFLSSFNIWFVSWFKLSIFINKDFDFAVIFGDWGGRGRQSWYSIYCFLFHQVNTCLR